MATRTGIQVAASTRHGRRSPESRTTLRTSTLSGNTAPNGVGGAIFYFDFYDELDVTNSTFSGNSAVQGGAIFFMLTNSNLEITSSRTAPRAGIATLLAGERFMATSTWIPTALVGHPSRNLLILAWAPCRTMVARRKQWRSPRPARPSQAPTLPTVPRPTNPAAS